MDEPNSTSVVSRNVVRRALLTPLVFLALLAPIQAGQVRGVNLRPIAVDAPESLVGRDAGAPVPRGGRPAALISPWSRFVRLGRRSVNQRVEFTLNNPKKAYGNAHYEVFADVGVNINTGTPLLANKILSGPVNQSAGALSFTIDFSPLLRRTANSGAVPNLDLIERLNQQGRLRLYVRVQPDALAAVSQIARSRIRTQAGARPPVRPKSGQARTFRADQEPSAYAVVDIGEPQPPGLDTAVEATSPMSGVGAWGANAQLDRTTEIRWHTQAVSAARFVAQINQTGFSQGWDTWAATGGGGQELPARPSAPGDTKVFPASDLFFSFPQAALADRDYYVRVVPLDAAGNLAGLPSNVLHLTVPLYEINAGKNNGPPPTPAVHLALESIEYRAENNQVDDTRFVINRDVPNSAVEYSILAALAGQAPKKGVKLQIVPQTDDESMWDALAGAVGGAIGDVFAYALKVKNFVDDVVTFFGSFASFLGGLGEAALDKGAVFAMKASGMPDAYIDKFEILRRAPGYVAGSALAVESQAHEMTVGQARNAFFNTLNGLNQKQGEMHSLPEVSPYLAQDPDFQYRPPTMFVKFKAIADKAAEGRLSSATSFSVSCTNDWKDASYQLSNGQALTGQTLVIDSIAQVPAIPDGAEIVVPIYLAFASAQAQGDPNWGRAWFSPSASHWQVWGKNLDGPTTTAWTRSF